ncbi:hypothetical protein [Winogradskyella sp.]|uniref:hypothetical protein n=1 Tax=Winogradskyella sp. TaxID=1883156 RepID=UPI003BA93B33
MGVFLDHYITDTVRINCYAIDKFFVEVHYDSEHNVITDVTAFKSGPNLDKYSNLGAGNWDKGDFFLMILMLVVVLLFAMTVR